MKGNRIVNFRTFAFSAVACAAAVFSFVLFYINVVAALTLLLLGLVAIIAVESRVRRVGGKNRLGGKQNY